MQTRTIESTINQKARTTKASLDSANQELHDTHEKLLDLKTQQANIYNKIATIYLLESPENNDIKIQKIIDQLQNVLKQLKSKSYSLDKKIDKQQIKLTEILIRLDELTTEKTLQLEKDPDYLSLFDRFTIEKERFDKETENFEASQSEFSEKLVQYNENRYFNYLIKRNYGENNYKAFWILKNLDAWLARFVNFSQNYKNYKLINSLLNESKSRYENQTRSYELALKQKEQKEHSVETVLKIPAIRVELAEIEQDLANLEREKQENYNVLNETQTGKSLEFKRLSLQLAEFLKHKSFDRLQQLTLQTKTKGDDILLKKLYEIEKQIKQSENHIVHLRNTTSDLMKTYERFNETLHLFKEYNISSFLYEYRISSYNLNELLNKLLNNDVFPITIVETLLSYRVRIKIESRTSVHQSSIGSLFSNSSNSSSWGSSYRSSSSSSSGSSSSRGSYSSSSSSGGGGYKTTDSF